MHVAALTVTVSFLFAYSQYVEDAVENRIARAEVAFSAATSQLQANSAAVRAAGIRTLFENAFRQVPVRPAPAWYGPIRNLFLLWRGGREYRLLPRSRTLFREYARTERGVIQGEDLISTTLAQTAYDWIAREERLGTMQRGDPALWFFYRAEMSGAQFTNKDLSGMSLGSVGFERADLQGSDFSDAWMPRARLNGASLRSTVFEDSGLIGADLTGADLRFSRMERADFSGAKLDSARVSAAHASGACFRNVSAVGADFSNAQLRGASFRGADLRGVSFGGADLSLADFTGADLRGADLRQSVGIERVRSWVGARLAGALLPPSFEPNSSEGSGLDACTWR